MKIIKYNYFKDQKKVLLRMLGTEIIINEFLRKKNMDILVLFKLPTHLSNIRI